MGSNASNGWQGSLRSRIARCQRAVCHLRHSVEDFIGDANFFPGEIVGANDASTLVVKIQETSIKVRAPDRNCQAVYASWYDPSD